MTADAHQELDAIARGIIDTNKYMVLGTADGDGNPWVSPVWYAPAGYTEFHWVSSPEARHSRNIAGRPQISIVVFDSQAPIGTGQAVYMSAVAERLTGVVLERAMDIFSSRLTEQGGPQWTLEDVEGTALNRLYRATATEHWILAPGGRPDHRTPVTPQRHSVP